MCPLASSGRTGSRRLTLGMRFDRFLLDLLALLALLDRFVAMVIASFNLVRELSLKIELKKYRA